MFWALPGTLQQQQYIAVAVAVTVASAASVYSSDSSNSSSDPCRYCPLRVRNERRTVSIAIVTAAITTDATAAVAIRTAAVHYEVATLEQRLLLPLRIADF